MVHSRKIMETPTPKMESLIQGDKHAYVAFKTFSAPPDIHYCLFAGYVKIFVLLKFVWR